MNASKNRVIILLLCSLTTCLNFVSARECISNDGTYIEFNGIYAESSTPIYLKQVCLIGEMNNHFLKFDLVLPDGVRDDKASSMVLKGMLIIQNKKPLLDVSAKITPIKENGKLIDTTEEFNVFLMSSGKIVKKAFIPVDDNRMILIECSNDFCEYYTDYFSTSIQFRGRFPDNFKPEEIDKMLSDFIVKAFNKL